MESTTANKEQAELAVERAAERERAGDIDGALRLLQRASRLCPTLDLAAKIGELESRMAEKENSSEAARADSADANSSAANEPDEGEAKGDDDAIEPRFLEAVNRVLPIKGDFYAILDVQPSASLVDIQKSYRKLCLVLHPDKNPHRHAEDAFKALQAAYETLVDATTRCAYDQRSNPAAAARARGGHPGAQPGAPFKNPYGASYAPRGTPCVPPRPVLKEVDDRSATVEWMAVADNGSPVTKYQLYMFGRIVYEGLAMSFKVTGLSPACMYSFEVVALNARGASPHSPPLSVTTLQGKPLRPVLEHTRTKGTAVRVRWRVFPSDAEATLSVDGKEVYTGPKWSWSGRLPLGTHVFVVVARNVFGASEASDPLHVDIVGEAPGKPSKMWCQATSESLSLNWTGPPGAPAAPAASPSSSSSASKAPAAPSPAPPPAAPGGFRTAAALYEEQKRSGAPEADAGRPRSPPPNQTLYVLHIDSVQAYCGPATSYEARDLKPATRYTVSLRFRNEHGDSPPLTMKFATEATPPAAPPPPTLVAADDKSVTVGLAPPADTGGSSVTSYKVRCEETGSCFIALGNASRYRFPALRPGRPYSFRVAAVTGRGAGPWSEPLAAATTGEREPDPEPPAPAPRDSGSSSSSSAEPVTIDLEGDGEAVEAPPARRLSTSPAAPRPRSASKRQGSAPPAGESAKKQKLLTAFFVKHAG